MYLVIGGGYSGAALAVRWVERLDALLSVGVIEPRDEVGKGIAYSAVHPDYRLNGPDAILLCQIGPMTKFSRLASTRGNIGEADFKGWAGSGVFFARRADFGRYMAELFQGHQAVNGTGTDLIHIRTRAMSLVTGHDFSMITLDKGQQLTARLAVLATSNEIPAVSENVSRRRASSVRIFPNPWDLDRLASLAPDAPILVLGTGLTAADVITALAFHGHTGPIDAVSRTGLLPMDQNPMPDKETMWERFLQKPPRFIKRSMVR